MAAAFRAVRDALPGGTTLDDDAFVRRHSILRQLLALHVPVLVAAAMAVGEDATRTSLGVAVALACVVAGGVGFPRRLQALAVTTGLVWSSVLLLRLTDGALAAHVHIFVIVALLAMYQDWLPFVWTVVAVVLADGFGAVEPPEVAGSIAGEGTWAWAALHGGFVVVACGAQTLVAVTSEREQRRAAAVAVELAGAQARIDQRESVSELLVNLARRNQALLDRQIGLIVGMEERESDPDALAEIFTLDHLATRIRRNAESLLVLSGEEPSRRWGRPVPLADVARAAVAEVEDYRRTEIAVSDGVAVAGRAVADVAHLLAELIENGLQFSPPESRVRISSRLRPDGSCTVTVEDRGIGLSPAELDAANDLIASPPEVDLRLSKRLGFHVVARLAARYGVRVRLEDTPGGGITVHLVLPEDLLAEPETGLPDDAQSRFEALLEPVPAAPPPVPGPSAPPVPPPRPVFDAPLPVAERTAAAVVDAVASPPTPVPAGAPALPRRVPGATLGPAAAPSDGPTLQAPPSAPTRRPDDVRAMLSRFQANQARARQEAAARSEGDGTGDE